MQDKQSGEQEDLPTTVTDDGKDSASNVGTVRENVSECQNSLRQSQEPLSGQSQGGSSTEHERVQERLNGTVEYGTHAGVVQTSVDGQEESPDMTTTAKVSVQDGSQPVAADGKSSEHRNEAHASPTTRLTNGSYKKEDWTSHQKSTSISTSKGGI